LLVPESSIGSIIIWQGSKETVPSSWALCDGTKGTPDLRNRFLYGNSVGTPPIVTGGDDSHDHDLTSDGHDHKFQTGPGMNAGSGISETVASNVFNATTDPKDSLPPWYSLCYIMFIGGD
jgi:hypothetical protein